MGEPPLPPAIQILSPPYQKAYRLLPQGPWASEYIAYYFNDFDPEEWAKMGPIEPGIRFMETPELGAGEEWLLTRMVKDADTKEWLLMKVRGVGKEAARVLEASEDRLEGLRKLVEMGWEQQVMDIAREWEMRKGGLTDEQIANIFSMQHKQRERVEVFDPTGAEGSDRTSIRA